MPRRMKEAPADSNSQEIESEVAPAEETKPLRREVASAAEHKSNSTVNNFAGDLLSTVLPETVTVTWGKELCSPKQFHTYEVGPYSATTTVREGETLVQAAARLMKDLDAIAAPERLRKRDAFLAALKGN